MGCLTRGGARVLDEGGRPVEKKEMLVDWDVTSAEKGGHAHFMIKEILEQPAALAATVSPRVGADGGIVLDGIRLTAAQLRKIRRIAILACGSAYHAGVVGKYVLEKLTRIPVDVDVASEFRYRDPIVDANTLAIVISQSGETADTLAAMREAKRRGARVLSIVNVVGSSIAAESDDVLYTWAGPEIAVATTKAYTTQTVLLLMLGVYLARRLDRIGNGEYQEIVRELHGLHERIGMVLKNLELYQKTAARYFNHDSVFYIGRNQDYALGMEGSLKLKEISYIHSESYAAGELKHGTISLIEPGTLVVALAAYEPLVEKMRSNIVEVRSRGAEVVAMTTEETRDMIGSQASEVFVIPKIHTLLQPVLGVVPLQLFAYYIALNRGCDIDKPRNLAKSVTVE